MRPDMGRIIVDKPRRAPSPQKGRERHAIDEDAPKRERMRETTHGRFSEPVSARFTDRLAPLKRWLASNCGRPWNKVYSEIRRVAPWNNPKGQHLLSHVFQYVSFPGERSYESTYGGRNFGIWFYVDEHWILRQTKITKEKPINYPATRIVVDADHEYRMHNGLWWFVTYKTAFSMHVYDILEQKQLYLPAGERYAAHKRQLGKREIKKILAA